MRKHLVLAAALAALAATGCTSYASARLAPDDAVAKTPEVFGEIEKFEFEKTVQVRLPAQLVVADVASRSRGDHEDLMVVTSMVEQVKDKTGALSALNLLVLPCFLVPTQTNDLVLHLRAAVVDVRNNLVYATFEDHREERVHATVVGERDSVEEGFDRLYVDSLAKMRGRIVERLRALQNAD
jgi:hypothetical protein